MIDHEYHSHSCLSMYITKIKANWKLSSVDKILINNFVLDLENSKLFFKNLFYKVFIKVILKNLSTSTI